MFKSSSSSQCFVTLSTTLTPPLTNATGVVYDFHSFDFFELRPSSSSSAHTPVHYQSNHTISRTTYLNRHAKYSCRSFTKANLQKPILKSVTILQFSNWIWLYMQNKKLCFCDYWLHMNSNGNVGVAKEGANEAKHLMLAHINIFHIPTLFLTRQSIFLSHLIKSFQ